MAHSVTAGGTELGLFLYDKHKTGFCARGMRHVLFGKPHDAHLVLSKERKVQQNFKRLCIHKFGKIDRTDINQFLWPHHKEHILLRME